MFLFFFLQIPSNEPVFFLFIQIPFLQIALIKSCDWHLIKHFCFKHFKIFLFRTFDSLNFRSQIILLLLLFLFNFHLFLHNPPLHLSRPSSSRFAVEMSFTGCWPCRPTTWGLDQRSSQSDPRLHPAVNLFTLTFFLLKSHEHAQGKEDVQF